MIKYVLRYILHKIYYNILLHSQEIGISFSQNIICFKSVSMTLTIRAWWRRNQFWKYYRWKHSASNEWFTILTDIWIVLRPASAKKATYIYLSQHFPKLSEHSTKKGFTKHTWGNLRSLCNSRSTTHRKVNHLRLLNEHCLYVLLCYIYKINGRFEMYK